MGSFRFDWRWVALIGIVAVIANSRSLPWPLTALTMAGAGGYLLYLAGLAYQGGRPRRSRDTTRVTYWRGQRIETNGPTRRTPLVSLGTLGGLLVYGLLGLSLLLAGVVVAARGLGLG